MHLVNGTGNSLSPGRPTPGVVKQDKSSRGSGDTTKTRSDPQRVRISRGERPIGAAKGKQSDAEALCQPPPPPLIRQRRFLDKGGGCFTGSRVCISCFVSRVLCLVIRGAREPSLGVHSLARGGGGREPSCAAAYWTRGGQVLRRPN